MPVGAATCRMVFINANHIAQLFYGLHESFVAYRAYERLRARGLPHDAAIREALGVGVEPAPMPREVVRALCFAGKA